MDGRPTWTDCDEAGDYDVPNVLKAKFQCHPARCLLPVEILQRCGLATGPATVELLPYLLPY